MAAVMNSAAVAWWPVGQGVVVCHVGVSPVTPEVAENTRVPSPFSVLDEVPTTPADAGPAKANMRRNNVG